MDKFVIALVTAVASVVAVLITKYYDKKREIEQQQRVQKIKFYDEFLSEFFGWMNKLSEDNVSRKSNKEVRDFKDFATKIGCNLLLWAGKDVIQEYIKFRKLAFLSDDLFEQFEHGWLSLLQFERIVFEIRKELGHKNKGKNKPKQLDFLCLYINDVDVLRSKLDSLNEKLEKLVP